MKEKNAFHNNAKTFLFNVVSWELRNQLSFIIKKKKITPLERVTDVLRKIVGENMQIKFFLNACRRVSLWELLM